MNDFESDELGGEDVFYINDFFDYGPYVKAPSDADIAVDIMFESKLAGEYDPIQEEPTMRGVKTILSIDCVLNMPITTALIEE